MVVEVWKDIPGYEGIYEVSNRGQVRTSEGKTTWSSKYAHEREWKQRILKQKAYSTTLRRNRKDARVCLYKFGVGKTHLVSRLVASAFIGCSDNLTVNHKDGNPLNNNVENLELVTLSENIRHAHRTGLLAPLKRTISLENKETGEVISFSSFTDASLFLGKNEKYISNALRRSNAIPFPYMIKEVAPNGGSQL